MTYDLSLLPVSAPPKKLVIDLHHLPDFGVLNVSWEVTSDGGHPIERFVLQLLVFKPPSSLLPLEPQYIAKDKVSVEEMTNN